MAHSVNGVPVEYGSLELLLEAGSAFLLLCDVKHHVHEYTLELLSLLLGSSPLLSTMH